MTSVNPTSATTTSAATGRKKAIKPKMNPDDAKIMINTIREILKDTDARISQLEELKRKKIALLKSI